MYIIQDISYQNKIKCVIQEKKLHLHQGGIFGMYARFLSLQSNTCTNALSILLWTIFRHRLHPHKQRQTVKVQVR